MNTLLIAPDLCLAGVADEVRQVSIALHPLPLNGKVTRKDLLDALSGHVWDIIWFATHGDDNGILLSDGAVPIADLTAIARASGTHLVVLNSCSSRRIGLEIHYELKVDVICTEAPADDLTAFQTGTLLARALASGASVQEAFERSRPGQGKLYHLFTARGQGEDHDLRTVRLLNEWGARIEKKIESKVGEVERQLGAVEKRFDDRITELEHRFAVRFDQLAASVPQNTPVRRWAWVIAWIMLLGGSLLFFKDLRDVLGFTWQAAFILVLISWGLSAVFFAYGLHVIRGDMSR